MRGGKIMDPKAVPRRRSDTFDKVNMMIMMLILLIMLIPVLKVFSDSLDAQAGYAFRLFPQRISLDAYRLILKQQNLLRSFYISGYVTVVGTILAMLLTTSGAFVLSVRRLPGRRILVAMIMFTMMFNGGIIPNYMTVKKLGLLDTLWAVILPLAMSSYNMILLKNFFSDIPEALYESAHLDGASPMQIYLKIVLPISMPALAAIGLFYFVNYWNDWYEFSLYITKAELKNFQVVLREMVLNSDRATDSTLAVYGNALKNAIIVVAIIPVMIIYPFIQRYFVTGLRLGAVKE